MILDRRFKNKVKKQLLKPRVYQDENHPNKNQAPELISKIPIPPVDDKVGKIVEKQKHTVEQQAEDSILKLPF